MKTKEDLFKFLQSLNIEVKTFEHKAVFTAEEAEKECGHLPGGHVKNLFLKDNKKQLWLIVAISSTVIQLKALSKKLNTSGLRFASEDTLTSVLGVTRGSVTPFALINDEQHQVKVVLDKKLFVYDVLNFHPLTNEATTTISADDFKKFLDACGNAVMIVDFESI